MDSAYILYDPPGTPASPTSAFGPIMNNIMNSSEDGECSYVSSPAASYDRPLIYNNPTTEASSYELLTKAKELLNKSQTSKEGSLEHSLGEIRQRSRRISMNTDQGYTLGCDYSDNDDDVSSGVSESSLLESGPNVTTPGEQKLTDSMTSSSQQQEQSLRDANVNPLRLSSNNTTSTYSKTSSHGSTSKASSSSSSKSFGEEEDDGMLEDDTYRRCPSRTSRISTFTAVQKYFDDEHYSDPVESVAGGYSTYTNGHRSCSIVGGGTRSGTLPSWMDSPTINIPPVTSLEVMSKNKSSNNNDRASSSKPRHFDSCTSGQLLRQHELVDWAEYPSPGYTEGMSSGYSEQQQHDDNEEEEKKKKIVLNEVIFDDNDDEEEEEDLFDDDVLEEHYRQKAKKDASKAREPSPSSVNVHKKKEEDAQSDQERQLVPRGLEPEEYTEEQVIIRTATPPPPQPQSAAARSTTKKVVETRQIEPPPQSTTTNLLNKPTTTNQQQQLIDPTQHYNGYQHCFITIKEHHRFLMLYTFLKRNISSKVIIFFSTTKSTQYYCRLLSRLKFNVMAIHNGMSRERFLESFLDFSRNNSNSKDGKGSILCMPDFQGNDVAIPPSTNWLVQFEPPRSPSEYIFRVGRISSECGIHNHHQQQNIIKTSNVQPQQQPPPRALLFLTPDQFGFLAHYKAANVKIYEYEIPQIARVQKELNKLVREDSGKLKLQQLGGEAYHSFLIAYASHEYRDIYNIHALDVNKVALCFGFEEPPPRPKENLKSDSIKKVGRRGSSLERSSRPNRGSSLERLSRRKSSSLERSVPTKQKMEKSKKNSKKVLVAPAKEKKSISNSPQAASQREQNRWKPANVDQSRWKPVKYEQTSPNSWMNGKKSWRASDVHADKMRVQQ